MHETVCRLQCPSAVLRWCMIALCCGGVHAVAHGADPAAPPSIARFADPPSAIDKQPFEKSQFALRPGEVVVFTGPTNGVFQQQQGWLETLLAASAKHQRPIFRHMCWEGDTVYAQGRPMNFGTWSQQFAAVGASTVCLWFGQTEALDDTHNVAQFAAAYGKLLDEFAQATPRLIVIGPPPFEKPANAWIRDNTSRNPRVQAFAETARKLAAERGAVYVDILTPLVARAATESPLTDDGLHFTPAGQRTVAQVMVRQLGIDTTWSDALEPLRREIVAKNRLWFDCWRTMNWYFPFGDRTWAAFDKPAAGRPNLAKELEQYKPLVRAADARVHAVALGEAPPPLPAATPEPQQPIHPPQDEAKSFQLRDGFDINLFADESDGVVKPIQICWDARGRLWAVCSPSYPQLVPGVTPNDYVLVCEDTNGDGRADKFSKFAEGLVMPTGLALGDGGVYVCETTQLIHLRDTDGDGRADQRRVILSGFGTGDSHQCINSLCWGPDARLWFTQGLHNFSLVETSWGLSSCQRTGVWRLNPRSLELHNFLGNAAASENGWGVGFDDWGQTFYTPGNEPGTYFITPALVPLAFDKLATGQYRNIGKLANTGPKGMRTEFLSSSHLPDDLQGVLVKSVYIAGYVELSRLSDKGSGFESQLIGPLISSPSPEFRPLETRVGPDGAIYICDWYNPIIGHYQASYRDPRRDHAHGRIWRMTARGRPLASPPQLTKLTINELFRQLDSPQRWVREQARQLLAERPTSEVTAAADAWLADPAFDASPGIDRRLFELTGVFAAHETVRPEFLGRLLGSPDARLRAFGTHMIGLWADRLPNALDSLRNLVVDASARVRLEAIVAASYVSAPQAVEVATRALEMPRDPLIDYALQQTVRMLKPQWFAALARGDLRFDNSADRLRFVLEADGTRDMAGFVRKLTDDSQLDEASRERLLGLLVNVGSPDDLRYALDRGRHSPLVLGELASVASISKRKPRGDLKAALLALLDDKDDARRAAGLRLTGAWQMRELIAEVRRELGRPNSPAVIAAAIEALAALEGKSSLELIETFAAETQPPQVRVAATAAAGSLDQNRAALLVARLMSATQDELEMSQLMTPLLGRRGGAEALTRALADVRMPTDATKLAHRVLSGTGVSEGALVGFLNQALGIQATKMEYSPDLVKKLAVEAAGGNPQRGRDVYRSKLANCTACHKTAGQGGDIGPDLSAVGKAMPMELIVESVLWPNRQVKEGFLAVRILTTDGHVYTGYKLSESPDEIQLRDTAANQVRRIAKTDVEELVNAGSVMPAGLTSGMTSDELRDLLRYLAELGKDTTGSR